MGHLNQKHLKSENIRYRNRERKQGERESTLNNDGKGGIEKTDVKDWFSTNICGGSETGCSLLLQTLVFTTTLNSRSRVLKNLSCFHIGIGKWVSPIAHLHSNNTYKNQFM